MISIGEWASAHRAQLVTSALIVALTIVATGLARLLLGRSIHDVEVRQRLKNAASYLGMAVILGANLVLWFEQISEAMLAVTALAAAFVIAAKELILCFTGGVYRAIVSPYGLGDRIETGALIGDVVDTGILSTTLFEVRPTVGQGHRSTGRFTTLPHSVIFSGPVINWTRSPFNWHELVVLVAVDGPWREIEKALLELAQGEYEPIKAEMDAAVEALQARLAWRPPPSEPAVFASFDEHGLVALTVRYPVRVRHGRMSEDRIVRGLLARFPAEAFRRHPLGHAAPAGRAGATGEA